MIFSGALSGDLAIYAAVLVAGALPNGVWRWATVFLTARLNDKSPVFIWVRHVATCLVAGVVAQLLLLPSGALAHVPLALRFGGLVVAVAAWRLARRNVLVGWLAGVGGLTAAAMFY